MRTLMLGLVLSAPLLAQGGNAAPQIRFVTQSPSGLACIAYNYIRIYKSGTAQTIFTCDNTGHWSSTGAGISIPSTSNLLKGNGSGGVSASGVSEDGSHNVSTAGAFLSGTGGATTGSLEMSGVTSGNTVGFTVSDTVAHSGLLVVPDPQPAVAGDLLSINGTTTCPTTAAGAPATCYASLYQHNYQNIGFAFDGGGSALTTSAVGYWTFEGPSCAIRKWAATVDAGTITMDVWKIAAGTAIPTVANTITAAATPAISSGTAANSSTLTGWTTSVATGDIFAVKISAISTATLASLVLQCY